MEESSFLNPTKVIRAAGVHEGMQVADFGAGSGFFTRTAARSVGESGVVWAVDLQRDLLPRIKNLAAAEGLHNVEVVYGDISHEGGSNLPAEKVDFVIAANVLFMTEHKQEALREIARVLKVGGHALIIDWTNSHGGLGPHPEHVITLSAAKILFEKNGFTVLHETPAGAYHWGFVVRKKMQ